MISTSQKISRGIGWMILFKIFGRGIAVVSTVVLARILQPTDFGLIAMATSIVAALELMYAFGFDVAIIQRQDTSPDHYDTAWTFNFLFGTVGAALLFTSAPYAAVFYEDDRLIDVVRWLAVGMFVSAFENIGVVDFRKKMNFDKEFRFRIARRIVAFAVTVPLAIAYQSYWALVSGAIAGRLTSTFLSYTMHPYRPSFSLSKTRDLFSFSAWLLLNNFLYFLKIRSAHFVIGRSLGARSLGLFNIAYDLSNMPTTELVAPINKAVFPGYAAMSVNPGELQRGFINVLALIMLIAIPIGTGIAALADELVNALLGQDWTDAVHLMAILAFFGIASALQANCGPVFMAVGKPRLQTLLALLNVVLLLPALIVGVKNWGIAGAAWAYLIISIVIIPVTYQKVLTELNLGWASIVRIAWRPLLSALIMYAGLHAYTQAVSSNSDSLESLVVAIFGVLLGMTSYGLAVLLFWLASGRPSGSEENVLQWLANSRIRIANRLALRLLQDT